MKLLKYLWQEFVLMVQSMWEPWPDDPLMTGMNRVIAVLIVSMTTVCVVSFCTMIAMFIMHPIILLYAGLPIAAALILTYLIVNVKIDKDDSSKNEVKNELEHSE